VRFEGIGGTEEAARGGSPSQVARLLVADDHALVREGLRTMLSGEEGIEVVAEAHDGRQALDMCRKLEPDLVLMDVRMPVMDGLEATKRIKAEMPQTSVMMVTMHENPDYLFEAVKAGAAGYVLKGDDPDRVLGSVRAVLEGDTPLDQGLAMELLRRLGEEASAHIAAEGAAEAALPNPLTPREIDVLRLLASGRTNRRIAEELHLSLSTVKRHLEHIIKKLEVSDRTQAAVKALEMGLLPQKRS
jgi:DNA-binding NarL/FixJ family response regulator